MYGIVVIMFMCGIIATLAEHQFTVRSVHAALTVRSAVYYLYLL